MSRTRRHNDDFNPYRKEKKEYRREHSRKHRKLVKQHLHEHLLDEQDFIEEELPQYTRTGGWLTW